MANTKTFGPDMKIGSGVWTAPRNVGVTARAYQELKTTLHRELLSQIDLEKLTTLEDVRARSQVREVINGLIVKLDTPLSTGEKDRLAREVLIKIFQSHRDLLRNFVINSGARGPAGFPVRA